MKRNKHYIILIMLVAIMSRTILINLCPGGIHADEAYGGYEAWSIIHYGCDSFGYRNPVYLTVWGGGMSVLNSVLMIPFVALFGLNSITVKLPAMIMGCISVYVFYLLLKRVVDEKFALLGSALLAISPWHIMISRYGMDANLAPAFILIALYLTVLGIEGSKSLVWSALAWGVALYSYVTLWIFEPVFLTLTLIYCIRYKKISDYRKLILPVIVLVIVALPLILFVLVNMNLIPEIRTSFMSIPRLPGYRAGELGIGGYVLNLKRLFRCFVIQSDGYMWNSIPFFGVYYCLSTPISIVGLFVTIKRSLSGIRNHQFAYDTILLIWLISAVIMAFLQTTGTNLTRINAITPAMFILVAAGMRYLLKKVKIPKIGLMVGVVYLVSFICFEMYYFTVYRADIAQKQLDGADRALEFAIDRYETGSYGDKIHILAPLRHPQVLFYTHYPSDMYRESVQYDGMNNGEFVVKGFGCFEWGEGDMREGIYIVSSDQVSEYMQSGDDVVRFDACAVVIREASGTVSTELSK